MNDHTVYTFSAGKYGHRISVLKLEITKYGTLSIYHISGHTVVGANGYFISPGGSPGLQVGSNKRLPDNVYSLGFNMGKWLKLLIYVYYDATTKSFRYIASRGIKIHPVYTNKKSHLAWGNPVSTGWTKGCFVIASDYRLAKYGKGYEIQYGNSIMTSQIFDAYLGTYKLDFDKKDALGHYLKRIYRNGLLSLKHIISEIFFYNIINFIGNFIPYKLQPEQKVGQKGYCQ